MSHLPAQERRDASDSVVSLRLDDDDLVRAALIFARMRDDADKRHAECAQWIGTGRRAWREPQSRAALRRRMIARARARIAHHWLVGQALAEWRPNGGGH